MRRPSFKINVVSTEIVLFENAFFFTSMVYLDILFCGTSEPTQIHLWYHLMFSLNSFVVP